MSSYPLVHCPDLGSAQRWRGLLHGQAQNVVEVDLERAESLRVAQQCLNSVAPKSRIEDITAIRIMRIERNVFSEAAAQQHRDRLVKQFADEIPDCHVDGAEHLHVPLPLPIGIEHIVVQHTDGEGIFAQETQMRQAATLGVFGDHGADQPRVEIPAFAINR